jgi:hypothetical protein
MFHLAHARTLDLLAEKTRVQVTRPHPFRLVWISSFLCLLLVCWSTAGPIEAAHSAQLRIRKELLVQQSDRALITVTGRIEHVDTISEKEDCGVQASIRVTEIKVAVVGAWINACSTKLEPNEIAALAENGEVPIEGVFRIWFERVGSKDEVLSEEKELEPYTDANPKHAIEIDPVVLVAQRQFYDSVRAMEWFDFNVHGPPALQRLLKRKVTIESYETDDGTPYVSIESGGSLPNHFQLKAVLRSRPTKTEDGYTALVDILDKQKTVVPGIRIFSIGGTKANDSLKNLKRNAEFSFWGITRIDGKKALKAMEDDAGYHIPIPLEFVLLDIHK